MRRLNFQDILNMKPCSAHSPEKYIPLDWAGTILDVLNLPNVAPTEKFWVACKVLDDTTLRLFAVSCASRALSKLDKPDERSLRAIDVAAAYAHGKATREELAAAYAHAAAAAHAADAAAADAAHAAYAAAAAAYADAAYAAAAYAAYAAATDAAARQKERQWQVEELIRLVEEAS